jgi:hypothetical protein
MNEDKLIQYKDEVMTAKRNEAAGEVRDAIGNLKAAIKVCPIDEALPWLTVWLEDLEHRESSTKSLWRRFLPGLRPRATVKTIYRGESR